jgi:hypothetical protein
MLVRFHALAKYLKFTNPWGSGESGGKTSRTPAMDAQTAAYEGVRLGLFTPESVANIDALEPELQRILREES